jgi:hypothetical protein
LNQHVQGKENEGVGYGHCNDVATVVASIAKASQVIGVCLWPKERKGIKAVTVDEPNGSLIEAK